MFCPLQLKKFSDQKEANGYNDKSVTDDMITEIYLEFSDKT
jgi:hypothetical protein